MRSARFTATLTGHAYPGRLSSQDEWAEPFTALNSVSFDYHRIDIALEVVLLLSELDSVWSQREFP